MKSVRYDVRDEVSWADTVEDMFCLLKGLLFFFFIFFFSSRRRHTRFDCDWSSDVCSSDLSNDYFKTARPTIEVVTHENTKKWVEANPRSVPAMKPDKTFADKLTLGSGKDQIDLYYFGPAHTNGDAFIVFKALRAMCVGDVMAWKMAPLIDPATGGSVIALPNTLEKAVKGIKNVDIVIEGHGDVNTWAGFRDYTRFSRALLDAAKAGLGKKTPEEIAAGLKPKFPVFTHEQLLEGMEYGGTPLSRAVINVNVAFQELKGEPVTTNFGPPRAGGPGRGGAEAPPAK